MARKQQQTQPAAQPQPVLTFPHLYVFDAGNGACKAISSQSGGIVTFEPVITTLSDKRALAGDDSKPIHTLRVDAQTLVFGLDDCMNFGRRETIRRLNSMERYTSADYFRLLDVLFLKAFACERGNSDYIAPTGVISLPVSQYNNAATVAEVRDGLTGRREIRDGDGAALRLEIQNERLIVLPESAGAMMHWAQDFDTLARRDGVNTAGLNLVVDIGYETTDVSLFEGMRYQRDRAFSLGRMGTGVIVRRLQEALGMRLRQVDETSLDRALRELAGSKVGTRRTIEPSPGTVIEAGRLYDQEINALGNQIADRILTLYPETINRVLLAGGGAYHLARVLTDRLAPIHVEIVPNAENANVLGGYTSLNLKLRKG